MAEHEFDKKEAQLLIQELTCYLKVLNGYCEKYYRYEDFDAILIVLKYKNFCAVTCSIRCPASCQY